MRAHHWNLFKDFTFLAFCGLLFGVMPNAYAAPAAPAAPIGYVTTISPELLLSLEDFSGNAQAVRTSYQSVTFSIPYPSDLTAATSFVFQNLAQVRAINPMVEVEINQMVRTQSHSSISFRLASRLRLPVNTHRVTRGNDSQNQSAFSASIVTTYFNGYPVNWHLIEYQGRTGLDEALRAGAAAGALSMGALSQPSVPLESPLFQELKRVATQSKKIPKTYRVPILNGAGVPTRVQKLVKVGYVASANYAIERIHGTLLAFANSNAAAGILSPSNYGEYQDPISFIEGKFSLDNAAGKLLDRAIQTHEEHATSTSVDSPSRFTSLLVIAVPRLTIQMLEAAAEAGTLGVDKFTVRLIASGTIFAAYTAYKMVKAPPPETVADSLPTSNSSSRFSRFSCGLKMSAMKQIQSAKSRILALGK